MVGQNAALKAVGNVALVAGEVGGAGAPELVAAASVAAASVAVKVAVIGSAGAAVEAVEVLVGPADHRFVDSTPWVVGALCRDGKTTRVSNFGSTQFSS